MSTSAQVLSLGADLVVFLAGVSLLLVLMLRPDLLGASALGRTVLAGAATLLATTALVHGALVDRSSQDWIEGIRAVAIVLLGLGCMGVGARWPRTTLLGALAVLVVGQIAFREDGDQVGDLLRFLGGCGIGLSLWLAARRSLATRISAAAGVLLVAVVLVLSGILSTVLTDNVSEQAIERASDRARIEAGLIDEKRDEALSQADFIVNLFRFSEDGREAIRSQDAGRIGAFLQSLRTRYGQVDFLAYFDQDKNLVASATSEQTGATILIELSGSPTVEAAFVGGLSAAGGGVEPTSNNGLVALGVQLVEFENDTGAPTRYGAMAAGFFLGRDYLLGRLDQDEKGQVNLSVAPVRKPGAEGVANNLLATTFKPGLVPDASSLIDGPEGERLVDDVFSRGAAAEGDGTFSDDNIFYAVSPIPPVGSQSAGGAPPSAVLFVTVDGSVIDEARASLFRTLFLVALGAAAVALALAAAAGSRLGAPLRRLAGAAEQISRGDLSVRSGLRSPDEIGLLGSSFDEMAGSIESMAADLREGTAQMEAVLNSMADGLVAAGPVGLVTMMNPAAEAMLGVRSHREIGKPVAAVIRASDRSGNPLDDRFELPNFEAWRAVGFVRNRDTLLPVALAGAPIRSESGGVLGAVYVLRDMRPELEIEKAKTEFLANISHELRTPLTPIKGYAGMLQRNQKMPPERRLDPERMGTFIDGILESSERLERTVDILVNFAAMEAGRLELRADPVDVEGLLGEVCARWRSRSDRHRVEEDVSGRPRLMADRRLLERSIDELIDNAVKFSPEGGAVSVRARLIGDGDGRAVEFSVSDEGIGISSIDLDRIFVDFSQLDGSATRRYGGLGLGLPFVQRVVAAHHGTIDASSELGRGSTFMFSIPVNAAGAPNGATSVSGA